VLQACPRSHVHSTCDTRGCSSRGSVGCLKQAHTRAPVVIVYGFGVDDDLVGEGVGVGSGNGRNMVFVAVYYGDDLVRGFFEGFGHGTTDF
jgi:hypothetical protein